MTTPCSSQVDLSINLTKNITTALTPSYSLSTCLPRDRVRSQAQRITRLKIAQPLLDPNKTALQTAFRAVQRRRSSVLVLPSQRGVVLAPSVRFPLQRVRYRVFLHVNNDVVGFNLVATERARGVRVEPRIHALHVEHVPALGQQPHNLGVLEHRETNDAFGTVLPLQRPKPKNR